MSEFKKHCFKSVVCLHKWDIFRKFLRKSPMLFFDMSPRSTYDTTLKWCHLVVNIITTSPSTMKSLAFFLDFNGRFSDRVNVKVEVTYTGHLCSQQCKDKCSSIPADSWMHAHTILGFCPTCYQKSGWCVVLHLGRRKRGVL